MELTIWVLLIAGLAVLVTGADLLVRGASRLALRFGISPLVIGLTVVAFGTSSPELAVSVQSGLAGQADIAIASARMPRDLDEIRFVLFDARTHAAWQRALAG